MKTLICKDTCITVFIATLFTVAKIWKQPVSIYRWMDKEYVAYIYLYNRILVLKKNEILPFATTQMDLEDIMLSEISQRKTNTVWYNLHVKS